MEEKVEMEILYYRREGSGWWERRSIGDQVLSDIPSPVVFIRTPRKWPWEKFTDDSQPDGVQ